MKYAKIKYKRGNKMKPIETNKKMQFIEWMQNEKEIQLTKVKWCDEVSLACIKIVRNIAIRIITCAVRWLL